MGSEMCIRDRNKRVFACGCNDGFVRLWSYVDEMPEELVAFPGESSVLSMAFSSDGEFLIAGGESGDVRLWRLGDPPRLAEFPVASGPVVSVAFIEKTNRILLGIGSAKAKEAELGAWEIEDNHAGPMLHHVASPKLGGATGVLSLIHI